MKKGLLVLGSFIAIMVLLLGLQLAGVEWYKFIEPKKENAKREVFENTQSFNEGKIQDLARYYAEYLKDTTAVDKEAIKTVIQSQFSYFDTDKIDNFKLRQFLIDMRGF